MMDNKFMGKKSVFIVLVAILIIILVVFLRSKVNKSADNGGLNPRHTLEDIIKPIFSFSTTSTTTEEAATLKLPVYKGRDPQEVNPNQEVIKTLNEQQKNQTFSDIKKYGGIVKTQPEYAMAWLQLGLLKKAIGDYMGAKDAWEYVALTRPNEEVAFKNLADLYWHYLPDYQKSEYNFKKAIAIKPDDISTYRDLSDFYIFRKQYNSALDVLQQGLRDNPDDMDLVKSIASFYEDQKDYKQALDWWQKAQEREPDNKEIESTIEEIKLKINKI